MTFTGTAPTIKVGVGNAASKVAHATAPRKTSQRVEAEYGGEASYRSQVLSDSPRGYWRLGETVGAYGDSGSTGVDGTIVGTGVTRGVTGLLFNDSNNAASFAHADSYVNVADNSGYTTGNGTAEVWVKLTALPTGAERHWFFSKWNGLNSGFIIEAIASGWRAFVNNGGSTAVLFSATNFTTGTHHLVITWDGTNAKLYVDGALADTQAAAFSMADNSAPINIGGWFGDSTYGAGGTVDEAALYATALSLTRIQAHYNTGTVGSPATTAYIGVFARYVDANNYVVLYVSQTGTRDAFLAERVGGSTTTLLTLSAVSPDTGFGALRLEVVGRRARVWYESQCSYVRDRPPDGAANLTRSSADGAGATGSWGMLMEANAAGTAMRITRFRARDLAALLPAPPHLIVDNSYSGVLNRTPLTLSASGASSSCRELEWEIAPTDPDDYPEAWHHRTPASATSWVAWVRPGYAYACRVRQANQDGTFSDWTDWQLITASGSKVAPAGATMPSTGTRARTPKSNRRQAGRTRCSGPRSRRLYRTWITSAPTRGAASVWFKFSRVLLIESPRWRTRPRRFCSWSVSHNPGVLKCSSLPE